MEEQPCENLISGDYNVTYTAVPRPGWSFVRWENCAQQYPTCSYNVPGSIVQAFSGQQAFPLRAVFEADVVAQPNILLIISDDQSFDQYGFAGHPTLLTPSIDALAAQSVQYPNAYVSSACRATFATLLTGLPEHRHGVTYIAGPTLMNIPTVADRLMNVGYSTYQAGKFWEGPASQRGFTDFVPYTSFTGNHLIGRTSIQPVFDFIDASSTPWFLWFSPLMPHLPHNAPGEYRLLYTGLGLNPATVEFYAMISWFDAVVGELLAGVPEDTVIIFLADNGYVQSETGGAQAVNSKGSTYEHGIRTQLLIRHPAYGAAARWELVNAVDVTATILAIAGAYHADLPGRDVLAPAPVENSAMGSRSTLGISDEPGVLQERWLRVDDWKYVDVENGSNRLHNLGIDPNETQSVIDDPDWFWLQTDMQTALEAWWVQ